MHYNCCYIWHWLLKFLKISLWPNYKFTNDILLVITCFYNLDHLSCQPGVVSYPLLSMIISLCCSSPSNNSFVTLNLSITHPPWCPWSQTSASRTRDAPGQCFRLACSFRAWPSNLGTLNFISSASQPRLSNPGTHVSRLNLFWGARHSASSSHSIVSSETDKIQLKNLAKEYNIKPEILTGNNQF